MALKHDAAMAEVARTFVEGSPSRFIPATENGQNGRPCDGRMWSGRMSKMGISGQFARWDSAGFTAPKSAPRRQTVVRPDVEGGTFDAFARWGKDWFMALTKRRRQGWGEAGRMSEEVFLAHLREGERGLSRAAKVAPRHRRVVRTNVETKAVELSRSWPVEKRRDGGRLSDLMSKQA